MVMRSPGEGGYEHTAVLEALRDQFQGFYPLLFNLAADPTESINLALDSTALAQALFELMLSQK